MTETAMSQGLKLGFQLPVPEAGIRTVLRVAWKCGESVELTPSESDAAEASSFEPDLGLYRHTGGEAFEALLIGVETNANGQALDYFDVIAGGVFRGQEAIDGAAGPRKGFDVTIEILREGVDVNGYALAGMHPANLSFLEIGGDPHVVGLGESE